MTSDRDRPTIRIEVVYALPDVQALFELEVAPGTTARQAVEACGVLQRYPGIDPARTPLGIFGRTVVADAVLKDGDRVEIYRPLVAEPKEARRKRVRKGAGRSTGGGGKVSGTGPDPENSEGQ